MIVFNDSKVMVVNTVLKFYVTFNRNSEKYVADETAQQAVHDVLRLTVTPLSEYVTASAGSG
jgi:hypothetical protein